MLAQTAVLSPLNIAWIAVIVIVLLFVVARVAARRKQQRSERDGVPVTSASRTAAPPRAGRPTALSIVELTPGARTRYATEWSALQPRFGEAPGETVTHADHLVENIMRDRGFPVDDFEARANDFGDAYQPLVDDYRSAHTVALRNRKGAADADSLRLAMVAYGALVDRLLGPNAG